MKIICGPEHDLRSIEINLPNSGSKIGIFVSGGLDSAILYHLLMLKNKEQNFLHEIVPLTVLRKEGSKNFAKLVVAHTRHTFNQRYRDPEIVGDNTLPEHEQVKSGVQEAKRLGYDIVFTGLIEQLPQHMINWFPIPFQENDFFKAPFKNLNKSHVVDICYKFNQQALFYITHSCATWEVSRCNQCNGCNERAWGFQQLLKIDPGTI